MGLRGEYRSCHLNESPMPIGGSGMDVVAVKKACVDIRKVLTRGRIRRVEFVVPPTVSTKSHRATSVKRKNPWPPLIPAVQ